MIVILNFNGEDDGDAAFLLPGLRMLVLTALISVLVYTSAWPRVPNVLGQTVSLLFLKQRRF